MHVVCNTCNEHCCKSIIFSNLMESLINVKLCKFLYKEIYCTFHSVVFPKYIFLIMYSLVVTLIVYLFNIYVTPVQICYAVFPKSNFRVELFWLSKVPDTNGSFTFSDLVPHLTVREVWHKLLLKINLLERIINIFSVMTKQNRICLSWCAVQKGMKHIFLSPEQETVYVDGTVIPVIYNFLHWTICGLSLSSINTAAVIWFKVPWFMIFEHFSFIFCGTCNNRKQITYNSLWLSLWIWSFSCI